MMEKDKDLIDMVSRASQHAQGEIAKDNKRRRASLFFGGKRRASRDSAGWIERQEPQGPQQPAQIPIAMKKMSTEELVSKQPISHLLKAKQLRKWSLPPPVLLENHPLFHSSFPTGTGTKEGFGQDAKAQPPGLTVEKIVRQLRDPAYSLRRFDADIRSAFPELGYYLVGETTSSGETNKTEYYRTICSLFCIYWLMRIGIDGERGFSLGVDPTSEAWVPKEPSDDDNAAADTDDNEVARQIFLEKAPWESFTHLLVDAGMLKPRSDPKQIDQWEVQVERTAAMLSLMVIHDIFKITELLPIVEREHAPFRGFAAGDVINDHDTALCYVLKYHPNNLPSYELLTPTQQALVLFSQDKMSFNHGWLVQGEAPPGALFSRFKFVIQSNEASPADVAFYFVHWLTDLAGAEPTPLMGSEKFVRKFPLMVLREFIRSFPIVNQLATKSEVEVCETYYSARWNELSDALGSPPSGAEGIAVKRLILHVQTTEDKQNIVTTFGQLPQLVRTTLATEMVLPGLATGGFSCGGANGGPAFLVYYAPAFIRHNLDDPAWGLHVLADVYRQSRALWPLVRDVADQNVTVRIDVIKAKGKVDIEAAVRNGKHFFLCRRNDLEAVVEQHEAGSETVTNQGKYRRLQMSKTVDLGLSVGQAMASSFRRVFQSSSIASPPVPAVADVEQIV